MLDPALFYKYVGLVVWTRRKKKEERLLAPAATRGSWDKRQEMEGAHDSLEEARPENKPDTQ